MVQCIIILRFREKVSIISSPIMPTVAAKPVASKGGKVKRRSVIATAVNRIRIDRRIGSRCFLDRECRFPCPAAKESKAPK